MKFTINLPQDINLTEEELKGFLAAKLFEEEMVTLEQGAEIAGETKTAFVETLGKYNVEVSRDPLPDRTRDAGQF